MGRTKKIGLASIVLGVGLALAWQFRKPADQRAAGTDESAHTAVSDQTASSDTAGGNSATAAQVTLSGRIEPLEHPADRVEMQRPPEWSAKRPDENPSAPSNPAPTSPSWSASAPAGPTTVPNLLSAFPGTDRAAQPPAGSFGPSFHEPHADPIAEEAEPERTHTIVDGDTLARLAERYLGRADRAEEIFAYNRDVLPDAELLPIGAELRIPSRSAAKPKPRVVAQPISQPRDAPAASPPALIPLPPTQP